MIKKEGAYVLYARPLFFSLPVCPFLLLSDLLNGVINLSRFSGSTYGVCFLFYFVFQVRLIFSFFEVLP